MYKNWLRGSSCFFPFSKFYIATQTEPFPLRHLLDLQASSMVPLYWAVLAFTTYFTTTCFSIVALFSTGIWTLYFEYSIATTTTTDSLIWLSTHEGRVGMNYKFKCNLDCWLLYVRIVSSLCMFTAPASCSWRKLGCIWDISRCVAPGWTTQSAYTSTHGAKTQDRRDPQFKGSYQQVKQLEKTKVGYVV